MNRGGKNVRAEIRVVPLLLFLLFLLFLLAIWAYTDRPAFRFRWGDGYTRAMAASALAAEPSRRPMLYGALRDDADDHVRHWIIHYVSKKQFSEEDLYQVVRSLREDESWLVRAQAAAHIPPLAHWDMEVALDALVDALVDADPMIRGDALRALRYGVAEDALEGMRPPGQTYHMESAERTQDWWRSHITVRCGKVVLRPAEGQSDRAVGPEMP